MKTSTKLKIIEFSTKFSYSQRTIQGILAGRTGFNDAALEDAYSHGLLAMILDKIHAQPSLPIDLKAWKESACQIDRNYCHLMEVKQAQVSHTPTCSSTIWIHSTPTATTPIVTTPPDTTTPMDIDSNCWRVETQTCYNCCKPGHIAPNCPESRRECVRSNLTQADIVHMISESVAAALDARDASHKVQSPKEGDEKGF